MQPRPFERQPGESKKAFEAFAIYRDMGATRSLSKVGEKLGKSDTLLSRWSSKYNWVERAAAYDDHMDRIAILEQEEARREMNRRHAEQAVEFQQKAIDGLRAIKPDRLDAKDLIKYFVEAVKVERLSRGEPTEHSEHSGGVVQRHEQQTTVEIKNTVQEYDDVIDELLREQERKIPPINNDDH